MSSTNKPVDVISHIKALHASYEARTTYTIRLNMARERQWYEWCEYSEWTWTEKELAIVINYLRAKANKGERNDGALKLSNLIGDPIKFEEDLNLALEDRRGTPTFRPKLKSKAPEPVKEEFITAADFAKSFHT
ncbi:MAG: hypothetical protein OJI67_08655 [Prosthecobacter sp.]|nr:hypothetical protein [Prosthecobacter sp.]